MENNVQFEMQKITNNIFSANNELECFIISNLFERLTAHWEIVYFNSLNQCKIVFDIFEDDKKEKYTLINQQLINTSMSELVKGSIDFDDLVEKAIGIIEEIKDHESK